MNNPVNCPYCETLIEKDIEICPKCKSWFREPQLEGFKFTDLGCFIALSILTLGFLNIFWFFINKKPIRSLILSTKDQKKFNTLLALYGITIILYFLPTSYFIIPVIFILNIALTYRVLRLIQKHTKNKYNVELDINMYYIIFFNILYLVHFIDTYTNRVINLHNYHNFRTLYGSTLIFFLILMAIFLDSIKFLIRM